MPKPPPLGPPPGWSPSASSVAPSVPVPSTSGLSVAKAPEVGKAKAKSLPPPPIAPAVPSSGSVRPSAKAAKAFSEVTQVIPKPSFSMMAYGR